MMDGGDKNLRAQKGKSKKGKSNKTGKIRKEAMFKALEVKIGIPQKVIVEKHNTFMQQNPTGEMTKEDFIKSSKLSSDEKGFMAESLFRVFDEDNSGTMDFCEFMLASNCTNLSSAKDKLEWIFKVFDQDVNGLLDF